MACCLLTPTYRLHIYKSCMLCDPYSRSVMCNDVINTFASQRKQIWCHIHYWYDCHSLGWPQIHKNWHNVPGKISRMAIAAFAIRTASGVTADEAMAKRMGPGYFPAWIVWSTLNAPGNSLSTWSPLFTPITPLPCLDHCAFVDQSKTIHFRAYKPCRSDPQEQRLLAAALLKVRTFQTTRCNLHVTVKEVTSDLVSANDYFKNNHENSRVFVLSYHLSQTPLDLGTASWPWMNFFLERMRQQPFSNRLAMSAWIPLYSLQGTWTHECGAKKMDRNHHVSNARHYT